MSFRCGSPNCFPEWGKLHFVIPTGEVKPFVLDLRFWTQSSDETLLRQGKLAAIVKVCKLLLESVCVSAYLRFIPSRLERVSTRQT